MPARRNFLKSSASLLAASLLPRGLGAHQASNAQEIPAPAPHGDLLPPWNPGVLEIHHLDTGRGNASFVIGPDGTSLLIDAGEAHSPERTMSPARPDSSRRAGDWIARYVRRQLDRIANTDLDLMFLTHLHGDHVGEVAASSPQSSRGSYRLTGAADVAEAITVRELIDRGWPDYSYPAPPRDTTSLNYIALAKDLSAHGTKIERARAGSAQQLALRHDAARYPGFSARVLSVNGAVWTGSGDEAHDLFPPVVGLDSAAMPTENMCCASVLLQYGAFRYYSGGDLTCDTSYGRFPWHDIESPVAQAAGPVSVAVANHHGYFDACGPAFVRALQPRVWVVPTWHASHPAMNVIANLFSKDLYPGERSVFATGMTPEALLTTERFSSSLSSSDGHVVVRVAPGDRTFSVHVISAHDESGTVVKSFGPFDPRA
jgi:L-ascorbate metabolism protein UlaG (beta-lactamase superfamily)